MDFAEILKYIMDTENLSQTDIADKTGFSKMTISRYINGTRSPRYIDAVNILNCLGYKVDICKKKKHKDVPLHKNKSGYSDPTASKAIRNADAERERLTRLLETIFTICEYANFHVEGRIELKDKKTGKVWK